MRTSQKVTTGGRVKSVVGSPGKDRIECTVCHQGCRLSQGQVGICGVRQREGGSIKSLVYGKIIAEHVDPIEKKPVFHVLPGSLSYSIATPGCNFRCLHCQNASISQVVGLGDFAGIGEYRSPKDIVRSAQKSGCRSISYTYVEPTIFLEYALDCCRLAQEKGLINVFVSNGYMSESSLGQLAPVLTAINVDLKAFSDSFYKKVCGARLEPVLENIKNMVSLGIWVEVTTLVIPGLNDSEKEFSEIAAFLAEIDTNIPWHVTGFYPTYKMTDRSSTPRSTLDRARNIGLEHGLRNVYTGNRPGSGGECSSCHSCGSELISRYGFQVTKNRLDHGSCYKCGTVIAGVWQ